MNKISAIKVDNGIILQINGVTHTKTFQSADEAKSCFELIRKAIDGGEAELNALMQVLSARQKTIIKGILEQDSDNQYFLKGVDIPMPKLLANVFVDYLDNNFPVQSLINFWKLLLSNPDTRVRNDLFEFLVQHKFSITDYGYFTGYKAVKVRRRFDPILGKFVSQAYVTVKQRKKNVNKYSVVRREVNNNTGESLPDTIKYDIVPGTTESEIKSTNWVEYMGNLGELHKQLDQLLDGKTAYEPIYHPEGFPDIHIGETVHMERKECSGDPREVCSYGLHVGSVDYVNSFAKSHNGHEVLLVLINPAHVVAVPPGETSKIRVSEYFPYGTCNWDGTKFEVLESPYFQTEYMRYEQVELEKRIEEIQSEIEQAAQPSKEQLDYRAILQNRMISIEEILGTNTIDPDDEMPGL
jgi:hypothetical protein